MNPLDLLGQATTGTLRFAGSLPPVRWYKSLPPTVRNFINPISSANPSGNALTSLLKGGAAGLAGDFVLSAIAEKVLPPNKKQELDEALLITQLTPGNPLSKLLAYGVLKPQPVGANEDQIMAEINKEYFRKVNAQKQRQITADQTTLNTLRQLTAPAQTDSGRQESVPQENPNTSWVDSTKAPTGVSLADYYRAQAQRGAEIGAEELLARMRKANPKGSIPDDEFMSWAEANPALAYRAVMYREGRS